MNAPNYETVYPDFKRNHNSWPLVIPQGGGKPIAYRRMTKFVGVLEDSYMLDLWRKRQVAIGLAQRDDLRLSVLAHLTDKRQLDDVCKQATEYAKASAAATKGTAFHSLTDIIDRGGELPAGLPDNILKTLDAFRAAMADFKVVAIEPKTVLDVYQTAGTPDRVYEFGGERYIGDTKTGTITLGTQKIAMQLAGYSRSWLYDVGSGERAAHGCSVNRGVVMDVDLEACTVVPRWIDLETGWEAFKVAALVWQQRKVDRFEHLTAVVDGKPTRPSLRLEREAATKAELQASISREQLITTIRGCTSRDQVVDLWLESWDDELNTIAAQHVAALAAAVSPEGASA